ncbi:hypothetical protein AC1031_004050 [Aphanomyces cochlioides]|nr:hypothetical protein AC1031_004050 [Aphanomyces cochlioides]
MTWNDAGEGHYLRNIWKWSIDYSPAIQAYVYGFPHDDFQQVYKSFFVGAEAGVTSLDGLRPQNGREVQGAFWYQPLLNGGSCQADDLGKPRGLDTVNVVATFNTSGAKVPVQSGGTTIGTFTATTGPNYWSVGGLRAGLVAVSISNGAVTTILASVTGNVTVSTSLPLCNYNYAVYSLMNQLKESTALSRSIFDDSWGRKRQCLDCEQ